MPARETIHVGRPLPNLVVEHREIGGNRDPVESLGRLVGPLALPNANGRVDLATEGGLRGRELGVDGGGDGDSKLAKVRAGMREGFETIDGDLSKGRGANSVRVRVDELERGQLRVRSDEVAKDGVGEEFGEGLDLEMQALKVQKVRKGLEV